MNILEDIASRSFGSCDICFFLEHRALRVDWNVRTLLSLLSEIPEPGKKESVYILVSKNAHREFDITLRDQKYEYGTAVLGTPTFISQTTGIST